MRILAAAPPALQAEYSTPEKLMALLSAKDMPIEGVMSTVNERKVNDNEISLMTVFFAEAPGPANPTPKAKAFALKMRRDDSGEWKLTIPGQAVDKYGAMLDVAPLPKAR
jgi:hypothetical protein